MATKTLGVSVKKAMDPEVAAMLGDDYFSHNEFDVEDKGPSTGSCILLKMGASGTKQIHSF